MTKTVIIRRPFADLCKTIWYLSDPPASKVLVGTSGLLQRRCGVASSQVLCRRFKIPRIALWQLLCPAGGLVRRARFRACKRDTLRCAAPRSRWLPRFLPKIRCCNRCLEQVQRNGTSRIPPGFSRLLFSDRTAADTLRSTKDFRPSLTPITNKSEIIPIVPIAAVFASHVRGSSVLP